MDKMKSLNKCLKGSKKKLLDAHRKQKNFQVDTYLKGRACISISVLHTKRREVFAFFGAIMGVIDGKIASQDKDVHLHIYNVDEALKVKEQYCQARLKVIQDAKTIISSTEDFRSFVEPLDVMSEYPCYMKFPTLYKSIIDDGYYGEDYIGFINAYTTAFTNSSYYYDFDEIFEYYNNLVLAISNQIEKDNMEVAKVKSKH